MVGAKDPVRSDGRTPLALTDCPHADWRPRSFYRPVGSLASINDHAEHARRRRTWVRGFSSTALRDYEEIVSKRVIQLTEALSARKSVDLAHMFGYLSWVSSLA